MATNAPWSAAAKLPVWNFRQSGEKFPGAMVLDFKAAASLPQSKVLRALPPLESEPSGFRLKVSS
jgi:hypothetical protein